MFDISAPIIANDRSSDLIALGAVLATFGWLYTARKSRSLARKQHTVSIMITANFDENMRAAHRAVAPYFNAKKNLPDQNSKEFEQIRPHVRLLLNHYEFVAAGIRRGDFDEKLVIDAERGTILNAYESSESYVFALRDNRRSQSIYEHLEWVHRRWEKCPPGKLQRIIEWAKGSPLYGQRNEVRD